MLNTEMVVALIAIITVVIIGVGILELIDRRRGMRHRSSGPKFRVSQAPKPELETTQKVRVRDANSRPVIRATQMRGKARRKF